MYILIAQQKQNINNADLLKSQKFVFIVTKIEKRPGTEGSSGYNFDIARFDAVVASTTSISQSLAYTSNTTGPGSAYTDMYYRSAAGDGSYFSAYHIPTTSSAKKEVTTDTNAVYFNWEGNDLMISKLDNPRSLNDINSNAFTLIQSKTLKQRYPIKKMEKLS